MIDTLFFVLCLMTSTFHRVHGMHSTFEEDLELGRQLKFINKSPIKSIHTRFGYIVDCIDINKQPAFDHPLLKNHKLQRKPSFQKILGNTSVKISPTKPIFGLGKDTCPTGTVPIRRTTKDDLVRAKSLSNSHILTQDSPGTHVAHAFLITPGGPYYGVGGTNSIYNPRVYKDQTSASHIWVQSGQADNINKIVLGWHVSPQLYGNDATYVYSFWTSDNSKNTGCYNTLCPGFVQIDSDYHIGGRVEDTSVYGGAMVEMSISLFQDPISKNWWVTMENKNVGYFPGALFFNLTVADQAGWGGRTTTPAGTPSPPMGSGCFPDEDLVHACYFRQVTYRNESRQDYGPGLQLVDTTNDIPKCFGVEYYGDIGRQAGHSLQFGGPGGDCGN